ncbi:winged helix-turn-helix domain-containing protein [Kitasatospora cineracea]|uniref:Regulatory GntR family protein n=1 Tax=Kitasatospora cineracea TaxID=88074 RepID=A0A3N4RKB1_9ACTN|nr:winged helix-turn-helix domain-containing protein [Kitasatospora cineracea]RPE33216.1 regulatory GntR family protein [Kitasatospora cineracea]
MTDLDPTRAKWPQIVADIQSKIESGEYLPGHKLSAVQLEAEYQVTRTTITKATAALRKARLIRTEPGLGSFVTAPEER